MAGELAVRIGRTPRGSRTHAAGGQAPRRA